MKIERKFES